VRDDFHDKVVRELANRAGNHCSNPDCGRPTSGPKTSPNGFVNIGVGAHITAAAIGGPRYDATLTPEQRAAFDNGIWLCQSCSSLIDRDTAKYTKELLVSWKAGAELRAKTLLETPELPLNRNEPTLNLPETNPAVSWLAFSARATKFVGRDNEKAAIEKFLSSQQKFSWWVVTGAAGTGKSRLALECCRQNRPAWSTGFLSKTEHFDNWSRFRPTRPTLMVMDYVASRAEEAGSILLQLSRSSTRFPFPVRVLLLERDKGTWWSEVVRDGSQAESAEICTHLFDDEILQLQGLTPNELMALAKNICQSVGKPFTQATEREFKRRINALDGLGRPLFAMMAAPFLALGTADTGASTSLLDKVLNKESGRRRALVSDSEKFPALENLILLATLVGGLVPVNGRFDFLNETGAKGMLPDVSLMDFQLYCDLVSAPSNETSLAGLQPDILGERFVLNRIAGLHPLDQSFRRLLLVAWAVQDADLCDFIVRATSDFPDDASLSTLCDLPLDSPETRVRWGRLVAELVRVTVKSDSAFSQSLIAKLRKLSDSFASEQSLRAECARAELYLGNIFMFIDGNEKAALAQFEATMARAGAGSDMEASAINNRGIIHSKKKETEKAFEDWTKVIQNNAASDEARACSFNNRADIFVERGDHEKAIADRSSVLALKQTSPDRRYIALIRRSRSYLATNQREKALEDLGTLLATDDIAPQQKAEALIERGQIYTSFDERKKAQQDFGETIAMDQLFPGALEKALVGLAELARLDGDAERAESYLQDSFESRQIRSGTFIDGLIVTARLLDGSHQQKEAQRVWRIIANDPRAASEQRAIAKAHVAPN
jgi:tetratricopeptide (TPR) repeat protein